MIARITFAGHGETPWAELSDDGTWTGSSASLAEGLQTFYASANRSPSRGDWRRRHAAEMADLLDGTVTFGPSPTDPPPSGTIY